MSEIVFALVAAFYWAAGLRIIPVQPGTKEPAKDLKGWPGYLSALPNEHKRQDWLHRYADYGVGLLLGSVAFPGHVLIALDVDDDRLLSVVLSFLGLNRADRRAALSGKKGKKGATYFVVVPEGAGLKSMVLKGAGGLGNIDVLAAGKMTVMPPSIHPSTGKPYGLLGTPIYEADPETLPLVSPERLEFLRVAIGSEQAIGLIEGKATHEAALSLVARLVSAGTDDETIEAIVRGLLPEGYEGDTLDELPEMIESARAKGFDSPSSPRDSQTAFLVAIATDETVELFRDKDHIAYATIRDDGGIRTLPVRSKAYSIWLRAKAFAIKGKPIGSGPLHEAVATVETFALVQDTATRVWRRIGGSLKVVEIDSGSPSGRTVRIDGDGFTIPNGAGERFVRGQGMAELVAPVRGGKLEELAGLLHLEGPQFALFRAFLISALKPEGPYFALLVEGEQGSGKSFVCEVVKRIVDPNTAMRLRLPEKDRDLMIQAKEFRLLNFDNASGIKADMSDALCILLTGGGLAVRQLYTDGELVVLSNSRPVILNGIGSFAHRPDLLERSIRIKLKPMPEGFRKTEAEMLAEFEEMLPRLLGALYDEVAEAIRNYDTVEPPRHLRMADAAKWIAAAEADREAGSVSMIEAISESQKDLMIERVSDDPLVIRLRAITAGKIFEGYVGELFERLDVENNRNLPASPSRLSSQLDRLRPSMKFVGIDVEFLPRDRGGRRIRITSDPSITGKSIPLF